jgi:16S rRNA (adenine1518-N6/adenine1519-N6)-dimethyltransferase
MIQKEVAERIAEKEGSKTYGILSVLLQAFYDVKYCFTVHENVFNPPPKVKSAVIRLERKSVVYEGLDEKKFFLLVKTAFNQRRKTLRNSLSGIVENKEQFDDVFFDRRPEQLSVLAFIELTKKLFPKK